VTSNTLIALFWVKRGKVKKLKRSFVAKESHRTMADEYTQIAGAANHIALLLAGTMAPSYLDEQTTIFS